MNMNLFPNDFTSRDSNTTPMLPGLGMTNELYAEVDLRKELHDILFGSLYDPQRGHWIAYRRYDTTKKSKFYNEITQESKNGPMYEYKDEPLMTRRVQSRGKSIAEQDTPFGLLPVGYVIFYFEHDLNPQHEDEIYEIKWDDHTKKPTDLQPPYVERFNIKMIQPYRDINGRIEYYAILAISDQTSW